MSGKQNLTGKLSLYGWKYRLFYLEAQQQDILAQPSTNFVVVEHQENKARQMQFQVQILPLS